MAGGFGVLAGMMQHMTCMTFFFFFFFAIPYTSENSYNIQMTNKDITSLAQDALSFTCSFSLPISGETGGNEDDALCARVKSESNERVLNMADWEVLNDPKQTWHGIKGP